MSVAVVIQARLGSTRLPRKVLADLGRYSMLERVVARSRMIGYPVCLTLPETDTELQRYCLERDWSYYTGPEHDLILRYLQAGYAMGAEHVVRVSSDCPLLDVEAARYTIADHHHFGADFTHYIAEGRAVEVFTLKALIESEVQAPPAPCFYREHADEWILDHPARYRIHTVRFSVDTDADLVRTRERLEGA